MASDKRSVIKSCIERGKEGKGIIMENQNPSLARMHYEKALRNIEAANFVKSKFPEWAAIASYYAMYQASSALLRRIGVHSRDHTCTIAIIEKYFVKTGKIDGRLVEQYRNMSEIIGKMESYKIEQRLVSALKDAREKRENFQYDIATITESADIDKIIKDAVEFASEAKTLLDNLKNEFIEVLRKDLKSLL